jgi:hypothetical protein
MDIEVRRIFDLMREEVTGSWRILHDEEFNISGAYSAFHPIRTRVKRPGREADHSLPSSVEVKNAWRYTSLVNTSS